MPGRPLPTVVVLLCSGALALAGCSAPAPTVSQVPARPPSTTTPAAAVTSPTAGASASETPIESAATSPAEAPSTAPAQETPTHEGCFPEEGLCFNFPAGWTFESAPAESPTRERGVFKNPDGRAVYRVITGVSGLGGGPCLPEDMAPNHIISVTPTRLTGLEVSEGTSADAFVTRAVVPFGDSFQAALFVTNTTALETVGDVPYCGLRYGWFIHGKLGGVGFGLDDGTPSQAVKTYPTQEAATAALQTEEMSTIVTILASIHRQG